MEILQNVLFSNEKTNLPSSRFTLETMSLMRLPGRFKGYAVSYIRPLSQSDWRKFYI